MQALALWLDKTLSRILLALLIFVSGLLFAVGFITNKFEANIYDYRRQELKRIVEVARHSIDPVIIQYRAGLLSRQAALDKVRDNVRSMTYSDLFGANYVFMSSYQGIMLVQPFEPSLEGSDQSQLKDAYGLPIITSLIDTARQGEGYVTYYYHPPERTTQPQQKVSYVVGIPELEAYIGTGMYVEDIQKSYKAFQLNLQGIFLIFFMLIMAAQYTLLRPMFSSYQLLIQAFDRLRNNPDTALLLSPLIYRKGSEAERLVTGFNALLADMWAKSAAMQQAHEELTQSHEELTAGNEELMALYTQLTDANELLRKSEERYRLAMEGVNDVIYDWDLRNNKIELSARLNDILGLSGVEGGDGYTQWAARIHPEDKGVREQAMLDHFAGKTPYYAAEFRVMSQAGEYLWVLSRGKALFDTAGRAIRMAGSFTDISEHKKREAEIWRLAYRDPLTGLANRRLLTERLRSELVMAQGGQVCGAMLYLDLDNFKLVNDSCGHLQGDQLLIEVADMLGKVVDEHHLVARLGGDEFVVLLTNVCQTADIVQYAEKLLKALSREVNLCAHSFFLSVSIGIVCYPLHGAEVDEILKKADTALYAAKNAGKNGYRFYEASMQETLIHKLNMERSLRAAVSNEEFLLYFQPIVYLETGLVSGFEALLRWNNPQQGLVAPGEFIPLVEESGLIVPIGKWVMRAACAFARKLTNMAYADTYVAVNVSVKQLASEDFVPMVRAALHEAAVPPTMLELEITETILMNSECLTTNIAKLKELKDMGVRIALDDFGTGYSSLTYLKQLPIDVVKIDKAFVDDLTEGGKNGPLMGSIIALAHNLGLKVVAEGVETEEQRKLLREWQCDSIQGYLISRPVPEAEVLKVCMKSKDS
ncbi:EAL domain-containing protein [Sporomusa malonica]|uniref:PAS domain S-box-containing protein/diguanylate cyclase (GGDEF) domain-containing protein n=1 Tax=Sporomusa malonica TaxID=112901 RepID=A0A1W1YFS9_9FIRM|nr:PAS domain S-box-containing protein/diguanylate cyclase (GGDEF) domain-containing protein [Sporomusa malonica]